MVSVPRGGPRTTLEVSTFTDCPSTFTAKRYIPVGAGPSWYSPASLYFEPWHGHSNHWLVWQKGTRHPRWTHFWYRAIRPSWVIPAYTEFVPFPLYGTM